jgi:hypothetical protein
MNTQRLFNGDTDRYAFDFKLCTAAKGYAQLDTAQDASYFGNWINPTERRLVSYTEGDITIITCESDEEFVAEVKRTCELYLEHDGERPGIDPFTDALKAEFVRLGLSEWFHHQKEQA